MCDKDHSMVKVPLEKADRQEFYRELHRIADRAEPEVRRQILESFSKISAESSINEIKRAVEKNDLNAITAALGIDQVKSMRRYNVMLASLRRVFEDAADWTLDKVMPKKVSTGMSFNKLNPRAIEMLQQQGASLVTGVDAQTIEGLRSILVTSYETGIAPAKTAELIMNRVGLLPKHVKAVDNYRAMLLSEGVPLGRVEKMTEAYTKRLLRWRARNIARTETIKAANAGQQALWEQAIENGLLNPNTTYKKWVITPDDRLCPICRPIPGDNLKVPIKGLFSTSRGSVAHPPAHPQCRCAMSLSFGT